MTARSSALPYWMGTPAALLTLAFVVLPLVVTLSLSFFPFVAGGGTGDQLTLTEGPCTLTLSVSGNTATALPNQTCTVSQQGLSGTLTVSSYTFTTTDGKSATRTAAGSVTVTSPTAATCTYAAGGGFTK